MTMKKPRALKILSGTDQPCRRDQGDPLFVEEPVEDMPPPPDWLPNAFAVKEWNRVTKILFAARLLTPGNLQSLGVLCACYGCIVQQYAAGLAPKASELAQYRGLVAEFGLTPVSNSRIRSSGAQQEEKENRFSRFGKRPE